MLIYNRPEAASDDAGKIDCDGQHSPITKIAQESWEPQLIPKQSNQSTKENACCEDSLDCGSWSPAQPAGLNNVPYEYNNVDGRGTIPAPAANPELPFNHNNSLPFSARHSNAIDQLMMEGGAALNDAGLQAIKSGDKQTALEDFILGTTLSLQGLFGSMDANGGNGRQGSTANTDRIGDFNFDPPFAANNNALNELLMEGGAALNDAALQASKSGDKQTAFEDFILGSSLSFQGLFGSMDANGRDNPVSPILPPGCERPVADPMPASWMFDPFNRDLPLPVAQPGSGPAAPLPASPLPAAPLPAAPLPIEQPPAPAPAEQPIPPSNAVHPAAPAPAPAHRGVPAQRRPVMGHQGPNVGGMIGGFAGTGALLPTIAAGGLAQGVGSVMQDGGHTVMNAGVDMLGNPATTMIGIPVATVGAAAEAGGWVLNQAGGVVVDGGNAVIGAAVDVGDAIGDAVGGAFSWL